MVQSLRDRQLIARIRSGDRIAFEELFNRYWEPLLAAALHRLRCRELSMDVLQELFIDLWEKRETLVIGTNVQGYLFIALKNRTINKIKSVSVREKYENMMIEFYSPNDRATEYLFSEKTMFEDFKKETEKLPDRCREVFELSRFQHMTHKEIGEKLNISPKTVENHIGKALKTLRPRLKKIISALIMLSFQLF